MAKKVTKIPAIPRNFVPGTDSYFRKRRACGYARVSTDKEEQESSFDNQMRHYKDYITSREDLVFVGMYSDEGISGTSTRKRNGFNQMVRDALDGNIDLIITKTVSRFARNTVDSLTTIRKLKEKGVEVYFEEQNIYTLDSKGELLITIMSSFAQEESRSISENTAWGLHKRFEDGKVSVAYSRFLGYDKGPNGELVVNPEQAKTVKQIYKWFLDGYSPYTISKMLTENGVLSPAGKEKWQATTVRSILKNEKYKGDAVLQKQYTVDFLTKKRANNDNGALPQYYVEGDHEAIIDPETYELVQVELQRRANGRKRYSGNSIFSSKIKCGCCGAMYGRKVWHSTDKRRKYVYQCNDKYNGDEKCSNITITEEEVKDVFISAINQLISNKEPILENLRLLISKVGKTDDIKERISELEAKVNYLNEQIQESVNENGHRPLNQETYEAEYDSLIKQLETTMQELDKQRQQLSKNQSNKSLLRQFISDLQKQDRLIEKFDERLWSSMVEKITVYGKDDIRVTFKDGTEITA